MFPEQFRTPIHDVQRNDTKTLKHGKYFQSPRIFTYIVTNEANELYNA